MDDATTYATRVWRIERPRDRKPVWGVTIARNDRVLFDHLWAAVRCMNARSASFLAHCIILHDQATPGWTDHRDYQFASRWIGDHRFRGEYRGCPWTGFHISGPRRGGNWFVCTTGHAGNHPYFNAGLHGFHQVWLTTAHRAKWFCEIATPYVLGPR